MTASPPNIAAFNVLVARLFAHLYEAFPERIDVTISELVDELHVDGIEPERLERLAWGAVSWLEEEGFISHAHAASIAPRDDLPRGDIEFPRMRLRNRALALLGLTPDGLTGPRQTLGDHMRDVVAQGSKDLAAEAVASFLRYAYRIAATATLGAFS